jgi:hypothetical protein
VHARVYLQYLNSALPGIGSHQELSNLINHYMNMYMFYALSNTMYKPSISIEVKVYMVYNYLPYISYFANKGQMGHLHITEH